MLGRVAKVEILTQTGLLTIEDLQITFNVNQIADSKNNKARVSIFNMSEDDIQRVDKDNDITLTVGYEDTDTAIIFKGTISECFLEAPRIDRAFKIEAQDGKKYRDKINYSVSYDDGVWVSDILFDAMLSKNIGYSIYQHIDEIEFTDKQYLNGFTFNGTTLDLVKKMCKNVGLKYTIINNELKVYNPEQGETEIVLNINENTSFLSAYKIFIKIDGKTTKTGWEVKSLLEAKAFPRNKIELQFDEVPVPKIFTVHSVNQEGSIYDGEFTSTIQVY